MTLKIIENRKIKSNKRSFNNFMERFHDAQKNFKIDCEAVNADFFSSETTVQIRHRRPARESIYYTEVFKEKDEVVYFFGLARDNVIATSNYLSQESHIVPILVANLHLEDSSKSNLVFASDSNEFNNVILLRIDCNQLDEAELSVLKNKNKITNLNEGKGFINFGAIGDFETLKNIRNFISNVKFEYDNSLYVKLIEVSVPENYNALKPDSNIVKDRFYNFYNVSSENDSEDVIDLNDPIEDNEKSVDDNEMKEIEEQLETSIESKELDDKDENLTNSDSNLYKYYYLENNELFIEMSISKKDFFKNMQIFINFSDHYIDTDLDYIEVLDMDDELLDITIMLLMGIEENTEKIKEFFDLNGFVDKG